MRQPTDLKDTVAVVRDVAVVVGIVMFTLGYFYRDAYFDELGVPPHASVADVDETILFATTVLALRWWWFAIFAAVAYAVARAVTWLERRQTLTALQASRLKVTLIAVGLVALLSLGEHAAEGAGRDVAHEIVTEHDVHFSTFVLDPKLVPPDYVTVLERKFGDMESHLVLVNESVDSYFIVKTNPNLPRDERVSAFRIPKTAVRAIHTFPKPGG